MTPHCGLLKISMQIPRVLSQVGDPEEGEEGGALVHIDHMNDRAAYCKTLVRGGNEARGGEDGTC